MKTSLVIFGVIFLVVGLLLYVVPNQQVDVDTSTTDGGSTDTRTSSANVSVPLGWSYAISLIGLILLILGFAISGPNKENTSQKNSYDKTTESTENIEVGDGNKRKIVKERTQTIKGRKN